MYTIPGVDGRINGGNKFQYIEKQDGNDISEVFVGDGFVRENDADCPPKTNGIDQEQRKLRKQCLCTMPADEVCPVAVAEIENERGNKVHNRQGQPGYHCDK